MGYVSSIDDTVSIVGIWGPYVASCPDLYGIGGLQSQGLRGLGMLTESHQIIAARKPSNACSQLWPTIPNFDGSKFILSYSVVLMQTPHTCSPDPDFIYIYIYIYMIHTVYCVYTDIHICIYICKYVAAASVSGGH